MSDKSDKIYMKDPRAKSVEGFILALQILAKYMPNGLKQKYFLGETHDEIFVWADGPKEDSEDGVLLHSLGFHWDKDSEGWGYFT